MTQPELHEHEHYKSQWDQVLERAHGDQEFRRRLLAEPEAALSETGIRLAEGQRVTIHEFDPDDLHLFLPPAHADLAEAPTTFMGKARGGPSDG